jgi:hypothetical protein
VVEIVLEILPVLTTMVSRMEIERFEFNRMGERFIGFPVALIGFCT